MQEDELLELYNRTLADSAAVFAIDVTDTLFVNLPPPHDITVLSLTNRSSIYPNVYGSLLVPTLQQRNYSPSLYPVEISENGTSLRNFPPKGVIKGSTILYVDVHFSPRVGLYLPYALEQGVSRALYASPIPSPSSLWEYVDVRLVRLVRPKESV